MIGCTGDLWPNHGLVHNAKDIYEGDYESHERAWTINRKAFRQGYYWPTVMQDAKDRV